MTKRTNTVAWRVDGTVVSVDLFDIDGIEWRDAKRATGMSQREMVRAALTEEDFEAIAGLLWIVRRREQPDLTYEDVLGSLSFARMGAQGDDEEVEESPPASGGPSSNGGPPSPVSTASGPGTSTG